MGFAQECQVVWTCLQGDGQLADGAIRQPQCSELDLSSCPRFWTHRADGLCAPPLGVTGPCTQAVDFAKKSDTEKRYWASDCLASWPCEGEPLSPASQGPRPIASSGTSESGPVDEHGRVKHMS